MDLSTPGTESGSSWGLTAQWRARGGRTQRSHHSAAESSIERINQSIKSSTLKAMKHISTHIKRSASTARQTERGELMEYFCRKLNIARLRDGLPKITMGRMGKLLEKIPTKDLYYIQRVCDDAENFSKKFWYLLNPDKYNKTADKRNTK